MMKKKVMPLSCLMAVAMLAGCGTAAPAVPEETTAPAAEIAEAVQETAPANDAESEAAAVEETAGVWQVEPCYNFDEIVPLYSEWDHTAGKNAADGLYAVRDGERWSLFSAKTGNIMMQDAAQQMPYLYGTNELSVWLDDEYYNYDNFAAMREKCDSLNAELQANDAEMQERLESATEALRVIVMFASKDMTEFQRIFFTNDVIALLCDEKPAIPPERYCTVLEKKEDLLWARIFAQDYMNFLFEPHKPDRLRPLLDIKPTHQPKDRTISTFTGKTTVTISNRRKEYKKLLQKMQEQLRQS